MHILVEMRIQYMKYFYQSLKFNISCWGRGFGRWILDQKRLNLPLSIRINIEANLFSLGSLESCNSVSDRDVRANLKCVFDICRVLDPDPTRTWVVSTNAVACLKLSGWKVACDFKLTNISCVIDAFYFHLCAKFFTLDANDYVCLPSPQLRTS